MNKRSSGSCKQATAKTTGGIGCGGCARPVVAAVTCDVSVFIFTVQSIAIAKVNKIKSVFKVRWKC